MSVAALVPEFEVLETLTPEEVGAIMLEHLNKQPVSENMGLFTRGKFRSDQLTEYPQQCREMASRFFSEGWMWLLREGMIAHRPDDSTHSWYYVTRRGTALADRVKTAHFTRAGMFPDDLLHPTIVNKAKPPFIRGEYDAAVFQAFKEVEVLVRAVGGFTDGDYGTDLMWRAFEAESGPLTDRTVQVSERKALAQLCAGAIGSYKNPHSHRQVAIDSREAVELLVLASHILRIVEGRRRVADPQL